jgi:hypothetical protein
MRVFLFSWIIFLTVTSCKNSAAGEKLSGSDSVVINFNVPGSDSVSKTVSATDNNAIRKMKGFVDTKPVPEPKCGYDGNIIFYSRGQALLPVVFKYKEPTCRHFIFELNGKLMSTAMTQEAADFLESLEQGKNSY